MLLKYLSICKINYILAVFPKVIFCNQPKCLEANRQILTTDGGGIASGD